MSEHPPLDWVFDFCFTAPRSSDKADHHEVSGATMRQSILDQLRAMSDDDLEGWVQFIHMEAA